MGKTGGRRNRPADPISRPRREGARVDAARTRADIQDTLWAPTSLYRHLFLDSLGLICVHDLEGMLIAINSAAANSLGYQREEGIGRNLRDFLPPSVHADFDRYLERIRHNQTDGGIMRLVARDGSERLWAYQNSRYEEEGRFPIVLGHAQDITELIKTQHALKESEQRLRASSEELALQVLQRTAELHRINQQLQIEMQQRKELLVREQQARREAESANRLKDEFLAILSHELRTPLNAILGWSQILLERGSDLASATKALQVIKGNARAQARLIDEVLDVSRIVAGKLRLEVRRVDLVPLLQASVDAFRPEAEDQEIVFTSTLTSGEAMVSGDPARLQQVVGNLLSNAVKFTASGGHVDVRLVTGHDQAELSVTDDGIGISPEFLPHVFERFRQADESVTRAHKGLGLGLAIVRHIVELHGGVVEATSLGVGKGSTFTVRIPLEEVTTDRSSHGLPPPRAQASDPRPDLIGLRIVVVDDDPNARDLMKAILEDAGARVRVAGSTRQALELLGGGDADVLVTDIGMPDEDGFALLRKVRVRDSVRGRYTPAIAVTAYASADDRDRSLTAGFEEHLAKPLENRQLVKSVAGVAEHRLAREARQSG